MRVHRMNIHSNKDYSWMALFGKAHNLLIVFYVYILTLFSSQYFCSFLLNLCSLKISYSLSLYPFVYLTVCWSELSYCWWKPNTSCFCLFKLNGFAFKWLNNGRFFWSITHSKWNAFIHRIIRGHVWAWLISLCLAGEELRPIAVTQCTWDQCPVAYLYSSISFSGRLRCELWPPCWLSTLSTLLHTGTIHGLVWFPYMWLQL